MTYSDTHWQVADLRRALGPPLLQWHCEWTELTSLCPRQVADSYLRLRAGAWGSLCKLPGARDRLLADPSFMFKVEIEVFIGMTMKARHS